MYLIILVSICRHYEFVCFWSICTDKLLLTNHLTQYYIVVLRKKNRGYN